MWERGALHCTGNKIRMKASRPPLQYFHFTEASILIAGNLSIFCLKMAVQKSVIQILSWLRLLSKQVCDAYYTCGEGLISSPVLPGDRMFIPECVWEGGVVCLFIHGKI